MLEVVKHVVDRNRYDHNLALHFAFNHIDYDRYINTIPRLTDWILASSHTRAGKIPPFNFLSTEGR